MIINGCYGGATTIDILTYVDAKKGFIWILRCSNRSQTSYLYEESNNVKEYKYHTKAPSFDLEDGCRRCEVVHDPPHHHVRVTMQRLVSCHVVTSLSRDVRVGPDRRNHHQDEPITVKSLVVDIVDA